MTAPDTTTETEAPAHGVTLTEAAAQKAKALLDQEGRDDMHLRIAVQPGGCAGLRYQLFFDERTLDGDARREFDGLGVVVDRMSAPYVDGAVIDFVASLTDDQAAALLEALSGRTTQLWSDTFVL